jgi:hypothetical protein
VSRQNANINRMSEESQVLRKALGSALIITAVCGVMTRLWA